MSFKAILVLLISISITVVFMQNTDEVSFKLLWKQVMVSKLLIMSIAGLLGFILGIIMIGSNKKQVSEQKNIPLEITETEEDEEFIHNKKQSHLSQEDQDYLQ